MVNLECRELKGQNKMIKLLKYSYAYKLNNGYDIDITNNTSANVMKTLTIML